MNPYLPHLISLCFALLYFSIPSVYAQSNPNDLTSLSLEDLMNVEVYAASKKSERLFDTAAATYVITTEDIRRSGARTIPELLRMVPGMSVQQVNAHTWDISARGFNGSVFANKLLVIMDGRAVYSPILGGVFWELQDTVLEDIERIEVIRGPGGALWGANAVNGIINIVTKKAEETQGGLVKVGGGTEERYFTTLRYGSHAGEWHYRTYGKYFNRDEGYRLSRNANDEWQSGRTGFRAERQNWTFQGDYYQTYLGQRTNTISFTPPSITPIDKRSFAQGGNFLSRYEEDDWSVQTYWQGTYQDYVVLEERRNTFDVEYNQRKPIAANQELSWGLGYRLHLEDIENTPTLSFSSPPETDQLFSTFIQDEIRFWEDALKFVVGTKIEHNIYTHYEVQPNVRVSYDVNDRNMVWAAASRAVRTPSRLENSGNSMGGTAPPSFFNSLRGNTELDSEKMRSFEVGYRNKPHNKVFVDVATFVDHYDHLITYNPNPTEIISGFPVVPYEAVNGQEADIYGAEFSSDIELSSWWKIKGAYTFTKMNVMTSPDITDVGLETYLETAVPRHIMYARSSFNLPAGFELDATLRYMDGFGNGRIPSNTEMDINISKTFDAWQVAVTGANLFQKHHRESSGAVSSSTTQIERSVSVRVIYTF